MKNKKTVLLMITFLLTVIFTLGLVLAPGAKPGSFFVTAAEAAQTKTVTVTFKGNGGTGTMAKEKITYGKAAALSANQFKKTGYTFSGWNTKANGTGTKYANAKKVSLKKNLTLYAQWTANKYKVKFSGNGGTTSDKKKTYSQVFTYGKSTALGSNKFVRSGYGFVGWNVYSHPLVVEQYVNFMIGIANDDSHGYCNDWNYGGNQGPDYDCGSLVSYALQNVGIFEKSEWCEPNDESSSYTSDLGQHLILKGFTQLDYTGMNNLQKGDILIMDSTKADGHVEVYAGDGKCVGAHWHYDNVAAGDQLGNEISLTSFSSGSAWLHVYRLQDARYPGTNGKYAKYTNKAAVKNLTSKNNGIITLYAQWVKKTKFSVRYEIPEGVSGAKNTKVTKEAQVPITLLSVSKLKKSSESSKAVTVFDANGGLQSTAPGPASSNVTTTYKAVGWSIKKDSQQVDYKSGASYTKDVDITLYPAFSATTKYESIKISTDVPVRSGYVFVGWSTDKKTAQYNPGDEYSPSKSQNTLYAIWKASSYVTLTDGTEVLWEDAIKKDYIRVNGGVLSGGTNKNLIKEIVIDRSVTRIADNAFYKCFKLNSVSIPEGVKTIGSNAFAYCPISNLKIPSSVTSLGSYAFSCCTSLKSLSFGLKNVSGFSVSGLQMISEGAFSHCENLESLEIPAGISNIQTNAFYYCKNLKSVKFSESEGAYELTDLGDYAFAFCPGLKNLEIPSSVKYIGKSTFESCYGIKEVTFGNNSQLVKIGDCAFRNCNALQSVTNVPRTTVTGTNAFPKSAKITEQ